MSSNVTGYGVGDPKIIFAPVPQQNAGMPIGTRLYDVGQLIKNKATGNWYIYSGKGIYNLVAGTQSSPITPYVVGPVGMAGYQTIQSAINAAAAAGGGAVFIQPGTYSENLTLITGVSLTGVEGNVDSNHIQLIGTHTPPTNAGVVTMKNINFYSTTAIFSSTAAGQAYIVCDTCNWILSQAGYVFNLPNWTGPIGGIIPTGTVGIACTNSGDLSTFASGTVNNSSGGCIVSLINSYIGAGNGSVPMLISGQLQMSLSDVFCPITISGGTGSFLEHNDHHGYGITVSGSSTGSITNSTIYAGSGVPFTMSSSANWIFAQNVLQKTPTGNAIAGSGAGTLNIGSITFLDNSTIAGTLTLSWAKTQSGIITANGNLVLNTIGSKIISTNSATTTTAGANSFGSVTLASGTAVVSTTSITAASQVHLSIQSLGTVTAPKAIGITARSAGTSFTITSADNTDTSSIAWMLVN